MSTVTEAKKSGATATAATKAQTPVAITLIEAITQALA